MPGLMPFAPLTIPATRVFYARSLSLTGRVSFIDHHNRAIGGGVGVHGEWFGKSQPPAIGKHTSARCSPNVQLREWSFRAHPDVARGRGRYSIL